MKFIGFQYRENFHTVLLRPRLYSFINNQIDISHTTSYTGRYFVAWHIIHINDYVSQSVKIVVGGGKTNGHHEL